MLERVKACLRYALDPRRWLDVATLADYAAASPGADGAPLTIVEDQTKAMTYGQLLLHRIRDAGVSEQACWILPIWLLPDLRELGGIPIARENGDTPFLAFPVHPFIDSL